jgi:membrane associated rhomboid family serine protease
MAEATCHRHPGRVTGRRCSRCGRPACPDCLHQAAVGSHCTDCIRSGRAALPERARIRVAVGTPVVTYALIAANVVVFLIGVAAAGLHDGGTGVTAALSGDRVAIHTSFGLRGFEVADGEWWRVITSSFVHFGAIHLAMNMFGLYILGRLLEPQLGPMRFGALYGASLAGGSLGVLLVQGDALTAGASGAIYGLLAGAYIILRNRGIDPWSTGIGGWVVISLIWTFAVPGISIGGHLGGMVMGGLAGWIMVPPGRVVRARAGATAAAGLALAGFAAALWAASTVTGSVFN